MLGRFISADTIVSDGKNPQQFNRYSYGLNNPVKYIDPSGHVVVCGITTEDCGGWMRPNIQPHPPEALNNGWNFALGLAVAVVSIPFEVVDYAATGIQCVTSGCTAAEVAVTLIPGAIGPLAKGAGKILGLANDVPLGSADEVVESLADVENAAEAVRGPSSLMARLPIYSGGKTRGILDTGAGEIDLISGYNGPSAKLPRGTRGFNNFVKSHVEAHAAAIMRSEGLQKATLYVNQIPCASPNGCNAMLPRMLPPGAELTVYGPNGWTATYVGIP